MSTRIIDAASAGLMGDSEYIIPFRNVLWISVLQSLSAYRMYRLNVQRNVGPQDALEFLFQSEVFPRAVGHCLGEIESSMTLLPDNEAALKVVASVERKIKATNCRKLIDSSLHGFIDELQIQLEEMHKAIADTWLNRAEVGRF
jgi:uncharacterized alpha-E superfamily protein